VDKATAEAFGVSAMPTLVITEADGNTLARSIGAPFQKPEEAIKWFDEISTKITSYFDLRAKWDESKHSNSEVGEQLLAVAIAIGHVTTAAQVYFVQAEQAGKDVARAQELRLNALNLLVDNYEMEAAAEYADKADKLTPAEGDARIDLDVVRAKILVFSKKPEEGRELLDKYFDTLVEKVDARAIDLADLRMSTEKQESEEQQAAFHKLGRELYLKLAKVFEKHERVWELKVYAAWYGTEIGDAAVQQAAKKELAEVAEKGEGQWKEIAKSILEQDEKGEEKEDGAEEEGEGEMG
jgi:hypothetical protein